MFIFFFKQKTAYEMRISDWSSDVCSSDLPAGAGGAGLRDHGGVERIDPRRALLGRSPGPGGQVCSPHRGADRGAGGAPVDQDRKSVVSGKSVSVRVDLGGRRIITKNTNTA